MLKLWVEVIEWTELGTRVINTCSKYLLGSLERFGPGLGGCLAFNLENDILSAIPCERETKPICTKPVTPMVKLVSACHI